MLKLDEREFFQYFGFTDFGWYFAPCGSEPVNLHISTDPYSEYFADPTYLYLSRYPSEALEHLDHLDLQLNLGSNIFILSSTPPPPHKKYIFYSEVVLYI